MPTTYAHYYYGSLVAERLPDDLKKIVNDYRQYYDIGVHGPDILFYHNPFAEDEMFQYSNALHERTGKYFFTKQKEAFLHTLRKEELLAYLMGFCTHYSLDSACHTYIQKKEVTSGCSHGRIEAELDRHLLEVSGKTPAYKQDLTTHLHPSYDLASVVSLAFPAFSSDDIYHSLKRMVLCLKALQTPGDIKRTVYSFAAEPLNAELFHDMVITKEPDERLLDCNLRCEKLMYKALEQCPELVENLVAYLCGGEHLREGFDYTFGYHEGWEDVPILSYEEELNYEV